MPPAAARPHSVDLLLCGHHYRTSRAALTAAGAVIIDDQASSGTSRNELPQAIARLPRPGGGDEPAARAILPATGPGKRRATPGTRGADASVGVAEAGAAL